MSQSLRISVLLLVALALCAITRGAVAQDQQTKPKTATATAQIENAAATGTLRVMSFNIRYNNRGDGENAWPNRKDHVAGIIRDRKVDVVGLQEALPVQIEDLQSRLDDYAWYGVGRNDGKPEGSRASGEFSCIFYRKDRFEQQNAGTFWLSETPDVPGSKSWDAAITRICSWVELKDKESGETFFAFNTHFDHVGRTARVESAKILLRELPKIAGDHPFVLTGDFNADPNSDPYAVLAGKTKTDESGPNAALPLRDARLLSAETPKGPDSSWNGFQEITPGRRIDYIWLPQSAGQVLNFEIIDQQFDGRFPSDHLPVTAEIRFGEK